ncbi:MAG: hypothetical protein RIS76_2384 [Verrucomicrobiota bacterium]
MNFLTPLFLVGGLAVALPVVFHLIRRTTRERTRFSSLMFLQPSPPRLTRKSRLEDLLLLLLRCLALALLAFGFARPFLKDAPAASPETASARPRLILLDTSASMRRDGLWAAAVKRVESLVGEAGPGDAVAVFTFDRQVTPLVTFDQWSGTPAGQRTALVAQRLAGVSPSWASTQLGTALTRASEALVERDAAGLAERGRIVVVSDLQEGSHLETLQAYEWPKGIEVVLAGVPARQVGNASLQWVGEAPGAAGTSDTAVRIRVSNAADSRKEQLKVGWASVDGRGFEGPAIDVYVPPGQSRIVAVPLPGTNTAPDRLILRGDDEEFDNTVFLAPGQVTRSRVLYLGSEAATDSRQPRYFLERAVPSTRRMAVEILGRPATSDPVPADWDATQLFVVTEAFSESVAKALRSRMESGKTALFVPKSAAAAASLAAVLGVPAVVVSEGTPENYAMLAQIDFQHPLFAPFADARFNDFTKLHFWKYRRFDVSGIPGARVVARFDRGDPALIEVPVGKGRALVLASGWNPDDSQWALSTKFVPWIMALLELAGGVAPSTTAYNVGDAIPLAAWGTLSGSGAEPAAVVGPDGVRHPLAAGANAFNETLLPGFYRVEGEAAGRSVAVNLEPSEGRTVPLAADELERLGAPATTPESVTTAKPVTPALATPDSTAAEGRQKLWRWFLAATLVVLLVESGLAGWSARRATVSAEAAT